MRRTVLVDVSVVLALVAACTAALVVAWVKPAQAAFPGKNGDIAFDGYLGGQTEAIYSMSPDGSNLRDLGFPIIYNYDSAFSPDGTKLAIGHTTDECCDTGSDSEILLANADGSQVLNLTKSPDFTEEDPAWFPSGHRLVYAGAPFGSNGYTLSEFELYSLSFDDQGNATSEPKRLTTNTARDYDPAVSPDGKRIAFVRWRVGKDPEIYVMRTGKPAGPDNPPVNLTKNSGFDGSPDWSPDGRKIVYASEGGIWIMKRNGSHKRFIGDGGSPAFSPDGQMITFVAGSRDTPGIWKMRADGTDRTKLTGEGYGGESWFGVFEPTWQPLP